MTFEESAVPIGRLDDVLREHGLDGLPEEPFPNDGWSGASLTRLQRGGGDRFILKRDSLARDWIAKATNDGPILREAWFANRCRILDPRTGGALRASYLGAGKDGEAFALLMPDLTGVLFDWEKPISVEALDRVLEGMARLHAPSWSDSASADGPWCPIRERITLICRSSLERPGPARDAVADRILPGWDAFDRLASGSARDLVAMLGDNPRPLVDVLEAQPRTLIHGDLKLANVGIAADGAVETIDWQMVSIAPIAIEIGWFLVANVASLPVEPNEVIRRYRTHLAKGDLDPDDGWLRGNAFEDDGVDAAVLVGLLLRGWRKGLDADAGITLGSGVTARDDLAWWCARAVEAADRIL
ncbi:MAG TPA: phosphotransferase [Verrucomicrobiae bacterium]|nr:phosphotransferase [Verrucomicrobiae bacterium]